MICFLMCLHVLQVLRLHFLEWPEDLIEKSVSLFILRKKLDEYPLVFSAENNVRHAV